MTHKTIEIFIVCIALLALSIAVCGCKDEAEAELVFAEHNLSVDPNFELSTCDDGDANLFNLDENFVVEGVEPKDPIQELTKLFEQVLDQEGRLIEVVGLCIERIKKLEERPILNIPVTENPEDISLSHNPITKGTKIYFKE